MKNFTKYINTLLSELSPYLNTSDAIDGLNPLEASANLTRIASDFDILDKTEGGFSRIFRQSYVNDLQKK